MTATQTAALDAWDLPDVDADCADCASREHDHRHRHQDARGSWLQRRAASSILFYQRAHEGKPSPCRFFPSCSAYALEAVQLHGSWRGGLFTVRRLLRCRPLGPSGFDPVPELRAPTSSDSLPTTHVQKGG